MNDLAEKALHGLDIARREIAARPVTSLGIAGFVVSGAVVFTGGRLGPAPAAVPLDHWLGLLPPAGYQVTGVAMGAVMLAAIGALLALWLLTMHVSRARNFLPSQVWTIATMWAVPFAVGPPQLTTDVYRYVAAGELARRAHSPYHHGADSLGNLRLIDVIDPAWRSARSTDGPLTTLIDHLAVSVSGGSVIAAVVVLRIVAVLSVIALGRLAADLAGTRRTAAVCLAVLNPAVLLVVVSAGLVTGLIAALLLAAILAARRRRWLRAVILACIAAGLKPIVLITVAAIITVHVLGLPAPARLRAALRDGVVALLGLTVCVFSVPFGLGWIANLSSAMHARTAFAPASVVGNLMGFVVSAASYDDLVAGGRIAAGFAAVTVLGYLFLTVRTRSLEATIGFALLAVGILAPVLYPSYLLLGVLCLAPTATAVRRDWVIALSCVACVLAPVGLGDRGGLYATCVALAIIGGWLLVRWYTAYRPTDDSDADAAAGSNVSAAG
ncbi:MAG TPA: hypothetical protein VFE19_01680 [Jatrophihabitantaceae bacterium]|nr:hypothetical protein [Jatrophihabitantaceae bacterium]